MKSSVALALSASVGLAMFAGCGESPRCITGMVISCPCAGGGEGVQSCQSDGTYGSCSCGAVDAGTSDAATLDAGATDAAPQDAGEPDAGQQPIYAGRVDGVSSAFAEHPQAMGMTGLDAGRAICGSIGADHVCDYEEVLEAERRGELTAIPMGTTAWVHRTTAAMVDGSTSAPGPGGRCVDWTFTGNHLADGEYMSFEAAGVPTYHLDNDTFFDGIDTTHIQPGRLECGGVMRAILCCHAP